jgi:hypothetical protein
MLGLILAMLYVAWSMVTSGSTMEVAVASTMPFLWYWHLVFACIFGTIVVIVFLLGLLGMLAGDDETKMLGAAGSFIAAPLMLVLGAIGSALFLGGVFCVSESITIDPETGQAAAFSAWNMQMFVLGCILYGIGLLKQISAKFSTASSSKD